VSKAPTKIGLISDTHGLLREQVLTALRGSELIVHAGDVGDCDILTQLRKIAPVVAVRGNVDTEEWARRELPETAVAQAFDVSIYVLHDVHALDLDPAAAGFQSSSAATPTNTCRPKRPASCTSIPAAPARGVLRCRSPSRDWIWR